MKTTLVVRSSNRPIDQQANTCVLVLASAGAGLIDQSGCSEVSFARNQALSMALQVLKKSDRTFDMVLMVDDDIVFDLKTALAVVGSARASGVACSACYALANGNIAVELLPSGRFMTGLGFLAIPAPLLLRVAESAPVFLTNEKTEVVEFTRSTSEDCPDGTRRWMPEDFYLTRLLGGAQLLPVAVGHLKTRAVQPDRAAAEALLESARALKS